MRARAGVQAGVAAACLCLALVGAGRVRAAAMQQAAATPAPIRFDRDIRPILSNNCFKCHGPDEQARETTFHFDTEEGAFVEGGIIVPGSAETSQLYRRITTTDLRDRMPPADSGYTLTASQIELLRRWIDEGAKWSTHWAFAPPKRPDLPAVSRPEWVRTPIDRFVLGRLDREGLRPSPEADRASLLRRVTYDLTGLPPTPAEVDAFRRIDRPTPTSSAWTRCWPRRGTANAWPCRGSMPRATATATGTTSTACAPCGRGATG